MASVKPLLELKNIGKIYVSDSNVSVGIRGVDLTFERGEFVAVTGASGSGKSTLLNVISGMDTYEEGELFIEGEPTSHYLQKDWEAYRQDYISFIFQDYNIIESFTVLQNVELALMNIEDPHARRERAMELLRRVGLERHIHHKGSKLSGGQKQRTVIARALAKESPIILADEPTGNLDSKSSKEIIELLREISQDKLVIVVTHNFDQLEACATRHIRIFDGAVELDHTVRPAAVPTAPASPTVAPPAPPMKKTGHTLRNGLLLGRVRFGATPKLSVFLCILMTLTTLAVTLMTALSYDATGLFDKQEMFTHINGRTVIARRDGAVITDAELEALAADIGAEDYMHYDFMLDRTVGVDLGSDWEYAYYQFSFGYPAKDVKLDAGRYPERDDEVILEVPISVKQYLGGDHFEETVFPMLFEMASYRVVGVHYYYDNTRTPRMLFTENGYKTASAIAYFSEQTHNFSYVVSVTSPDDPNESIGVGSSMGIPTLVDFDLEPGTYFYNDPWTWETVNRQYPDQPVKITLAGDFRNYHYYTDSFVVHGDVMIEEIYPGDEYGAKASVQYAFDSHTMPTSVPEATKSRIERYYHSDWGENTFFEGTSFMLISPDILQDFMYRHYYTKAYTQASLFFENDRAARDQVEALRELGYVAVVSNETVDPDVFTLLTTKLSMVMDALGWVITVVFATLFLSLCSSRAMNATRGDIAIMRSMGIPTGVVRVSVYVQTLIALIPAFIVTAITCTAIYLIPKTNYIFGFLHARDYIILAVVLIAIAFNLARRNVAKMFNESVKKTLKGGKQA